MSGENESDSGEQEPGGGNKEEKSDGENEPGNGENKEENPGGETEENGSDDTEQNETENTDHAEPDGAELKQEIYTVTMPEYHAENAGTAEVKTLIGGITWDSTPAYDADTAGTYTFTATLPEGYTLAEGVSMPEIRVTVQDGSDEVVQELLARIAALPEAEEILAKEPEAEDEETYEEWMAELSMYGEEAFAILEAYEELTEEQQAQIPEEAVIKLTAWVELADMITGGAETYAIENPNTGNGTCGDNATWSVAGGVLRIEGTGAMNDYAGASALPWEKKYFSQIQIGDEITYIGKNAFAGGMIIQQVSEINIPESVSGIGVGAFSGCTGLKFITFSWTKKEDIMELSADFLPDSVLRISIPGSGSCEYLRAYLETPGWLAYKDKLTYQISHKSIEKIEAKEPTCMATGNKEYWRCQACEELFSDSTAKTATTLEAVILPVDAANHSYTYSASGAVITESCANGCGHSAQATLSVKSGANLTYTGSEIKPVTVTYSNGWGGTGTDYKPDDAKISYTNNTNADVAKAELTIGSAKAAVDFRITEAVMTGVTASGYTGTYDGSAHGITVTVPTGATVKYRKEASGSYTLTASPAYTDVGTYTVYYQVTKSNYMSVTGFAQVKINACSISSAAVTLDGTALTYNGSAQTKEISSVAVTADAKKLTLNAGTDYTVSGNQGTDAGTYTMTLAGKGNYTGTKTVNFTIASKSLTAGMLTIADGPYYYTGTAVTPAVTVKDGGRTLTKDTDYTLNYTNNINTGTATVTIQGKGNYKGNVSRNFTIQYRPLPSGKSLTDYVTASPAPTDGWYNAEITLTPKGGCGVGETPSGIGSTVVTASGETGADGTTKTIYIKDGSGNIYQTTFTYKLDKTPPTIGLSNMSVTNGTKGLFNWIIGKKSMIIRIPETDVTDALSGIREVSYTAVPDSGTQQTQTIQAQGGSYEISLNAEFSGTIKLTAKDKAGNAAEVSLTAEGGKVVAEDYAPIIRMTLPVTPQPNANRWYNTTVSVNVTVTDDKNADDTGIVSGGIAAIVWKDGEDGAAQNVTGLPGTAPVYEKKFTITADTDGTHTYYVQATDNAGNVSGWQTVTVRLDTGSPTFSANPSVTDRTQEGADITFTPSEGGKAYWIVSDTGTAPDAQAVVTGAQEDAGKGGVKDVIGDTPDTVTVTGLTPGEEHTVYMVLEDAAGNLSEVKEVRFTTLQKAPEIVLGDLVIDHEKEMVKIPGGIGEVEVYTDPADPSGSKIQQEADGSLPVEPGTTIYIRYPEKTQDGETTPASDAAKIDIPGRPAAPAPKQTTVTDTTVTVTNPADGEEYLLVEKGSLPDGAEPDWDNADKVNDTGAFTGLDPNKEYDLYVRKKETEDDFASTSAKTGVRTHVTIDEPEITGDGAGKPGNTAQRPAKPDEGGATVTYTGAYEDEYTPVIKVGGKEIIPGAGTPGAEGSEMNWDEEAGQGKWKYVYPVPDGATEADITVEFRKRTVTGITAKPENFSIYADDTANRDAIQAGDVAPLTAYLKKACSVEAAYDNGTKGNLQETSSFTTADNFVQKGAVYRYTVSAGEKTCTAVLTVEPVAASVQNPDALAKTRKNGGYTAQEVGAWLPEQVTVSYTGTGYTTRTESLPVTWDTNSIGEDFGAAVGEETVNGTAKLPAWATGEDAVSIVIRFENKKPSSGGGDSSGGSGAAGNEGDGDSSDGNGGESSNGDSSNGDSSSDGNNGNTPENGDHPGAPAVTPPPAAAPQPPIRTEPLKQPQPETGRDDPGRSEGADQETAATAGQQEGQTDFDAETGGQTKEGTDGADSGGQPEGAEAGTVTALTDGGRIVLSGEPVATGNVQGMSDISTVLKVGDGAIIVTVVCAEQEYTAGVADTTTVVNAVLMPEQIELVNGGGTIEIRIDVKDISEKVPAQDKEAIESGIGAYREEAPGLALGMYVDISMFMKIGAGDWDAVTATEEPIEVVVGIPETLQSGGREFFIIRAHEGECTLLRDLDDAAETITIGTDRFSSYAIAYVETEGTGAVSKEKCSLCHICPTFLGICCFIWLIVITAAVIVVVFMQRRGRKEQERK